MIAATHCSRCGDPCLENKPGDASARPFRRAKRGHCAACAVVMFFRDINPDRGLGFALPEDFEPSGLLLPHIQEQFRRVLLTGGSELTAEQIDWRQVIQRWDTNTGSKDFGALSPAITKGDSAT